jgi:hypothetical protein
LQIFLYKRLYDLCTKIVHLRFPSQQSLKLSKCLPSKINRVFSPAFIRRSLSTQLLNKKIATSQFAKWNFYHERPPPQHQYADAERCARRCIGDILSAHTHAEVRGRLGEHVNHAGRVLLLLRRFSCGLDLFSFLRAHSGLGPGEKHQRRSE